MSNIVTVGDREFTIGRPRPRHYLYLLRFLKDLFKSGYGEMIGLMPDGEEGEDIAPLEAFFALVDKISETDLNRFGAILLQFDDIDEGLAFIDAQNGVDLVWLTEAFAINCEVADIGLVVSNFRRAQNAWGKWKRAK
ncbi:hypothetical protein D4Q85_00745 [bacterium]|nr:MAG: hypothetical protein D4Q85_00745 [bacterium]